MFAKSYSTWVFAFGLVAILGVGSPVAHAQDDLDELDIELDGSETETSSQNTSDSGTTEVDTSNLDDADFSTGENATDGGDDFADFDDEAPGTQEEHTEVVDESLEPLDGAVEEDPSLLAEPMPEPTPEPVSPEETSPSYAAGPDEPDLEYESRLYNIYVNFHSRETSQEQWNAMVGERQTESYRIQAGDTLWGVSQTLFGDGNYWPKIWSLNGRITNPHLIKPGHTIRFVLGDESDAPAFTVSEAEDTNVTEAPMVASNQSSTVVASMNEVEIPDPEHVSRPVVMKLPPSLPEWTSQNRGGNYDDSGIDYGKRPIVTLQDRLPLAAYITQAEPKTLGTVQEIETGASAASTFQYVYVELAPGSAQTGDELLSIRNRGKLRPANREVPKDLGFSIEVSAKLKLVDKVQSRAKGDMFRALVLRTLSPVTVGNQLLRGEIENLVLSEKGPRSQVVAQIVGGNSDETRQLFGPQSFAYLNRGSNDGLAVGQVLPIRANRRVRNEDTLVVENPVPVGYMQIVKVEPNVSTGVILRVWEQIYQGDLTGDGGKMSNSVTGIEEESLTGDDLDSGSEAEPDDLSGPEAADASGAPEATPQPDLVDPDGENLDEEMELEEL